MKTTLTLNSVLAVLLISVVAMFSSCSTTGRFAQNTHYHLNLVKADKHTVPAESKKSETTTASPDIAPLLSHSSMVAYDDKQLDGLTTLLQSNLNSVKKEIKKTDPAMYHQIKSLDLNKTIRQISKNSSVFSVTHKSSIEQSGDSPHYFSLFLIFLLLAILFYVLTIVALIFFVFAVLANIAAVIFFILWIVSLA